MQRDFDTEFKDLVKSTISPRLKLLDYKKSNLNYNRQLDKLIHCLKIQKSRWNHSELISFTVNHGFFNGSIYKTNWNKQDLPKFVNGYPEKLIDPYGNEITFHYKCDQ